MSIFDWLGVPFRYCLEFLTNAFNALGPLKTVGGFGLGIIATTLIIRAALFPIFGWQLRTSRRIQAEQRLIAPQLQALRKKYKGRPQELSAEMQKLYAEHKVSPFSSLSGCLPALVQMPVLIGLYRGISAVTDPKNHLLGSADLGFLWIQNLADSALKAAGNSWGGLPTHPAVLILPLLAAVLTFAQSRMMMPPPRPDMTDQERTMANVTRQMSFLFPVMIFFFSVNFPQGLGLYWVTGTLFMVLQQFHLVGWGSLNVPAWFPGAARTTPLSYPKHTDIKTAKDPAAKAARQPAPATAAAAALSAPGGSGGNGTRPRVAETPPTVVTPEGVRVTPPSRPPRRRNNKRRR